MDSLWTLAGWIWSYGIVFLLVLTLVVFIHELGHFLVARWCGVAVKVFSIGFGPEIFGFNDKYGTRWRFAWIPLGGYVKFVDDENAASKPDGEALKRMSAAEREGSFHAKPVSQRAAVVAAGPIANFLLAIVIYTGLNMSYGVLQATPAVVDGVQAESPAARAGFQTGDKIVSIDGQPVEKFEDLQSHVMCSAGREMAFSIERGGKSLTLFATPIVKEDRDPFGRAQRRALIGIQRSVSQGKTPVGPAGAVAAATKETFNTISQTLFGLGSIVSACQSAEQLGGPILMAEVTAKLASLGIEPMLRWIAFISTSIGFLNLLPIPVLDGGHLLFYVYEAIRRKPVSERFQQFGFQVGLALLMMLMIFVNFNDLLNVWRRVTGAG